MKKISKLLVMAVVVLAVVTMSLYVNAAEGHNILIEYIKAPHNVNGMLFELTNSQKNAIADHINTLDEATVGAIHADLVSMENAIRDTGATNTNQLSKEFKTDILNKAKATATKAGLALGVDTSNKTFKLTKVANGEVLASGRYTVLATNPGSAQVGRGAGAPAGTGAATNTGAKLLYTGSNYAVIALPVLAIIAVAYVVKKRA